VETITLSTALLLVLGLGIYFRLRVAGLERRFAPLKRLEAKVDLLLEAGGLVYEPLGGAADVEDALQSGEKLRAVSLYRASHACSLAEAKDAIEKIQAAPSIPMRR
jgi:hypothetical protein